MKIHNRSLKMTNFIFILLVIFTVCGILVYPQEVFDSSKKGLLLWFNTVFPSLLPFMICTYLLIELGVIHFLGILFEPIMRPIFNVSGIGAFPWVMGLISGYPVGAKITADLRSTGEISQVEAQRLIAFSNNSGPLFILGAVSVGMLKRPDVGIFLLGIHYLSSLSVGLLFRFYKKEKTSRKAKRKHIVKTAIKELISIQNKQTKKLGAILKDSIMSSMELVVQIGGFIILFSVIAELLKMTPILLYLEQLLSPTFNLIGFDTNLISGWILGVIEITNGINIIGASSTPFHQQLILVSSVIAWGGLSIFMQTISVISHSDIKISVYGLAKLIQALFAFIYTLLFYPYLKHIAFKSQAVFNVPQYIPPNEIWIQGYICICIVLYLLLFITKKLSQKRKVG